MHTSVIISLDIVLLGFNARDWEGHPTQRICVLGYRREYSVSYKDVNENALEKKFLHGFYIH